MNGAPPRPVQTPLERMTGKVLARRVTLVPILRAGLGMAEGILDLIPEAQVWHIGVYRDETTLQPMEYYNHIRDRCRVDVAAHAGIPACRRCDGMVVIPAGRDCGSGKQHEDRLIGP